MKKIMITFIILFTTAILSNSDVRNQNILGETPIKKSINHIKVDEQLKPYLIRLYKIVKENNLNVDWGKIESADILPLRYGIQGLWSPSSHVVIVSYYIQFPLYSNMTKQEKDDFVLIVLAHEVGHSQGLRHTDGKGIDLMNPTSQHDLAVIRGSIGAEQYIINTFKAKL